MSGFIGGMGEELGFTEIRPVNPVMALIAAMFFNMFFAVLMSLMVSVILSIYNILAKLAGGFKFEFAEEKALEILTFNQPQAYQQQTTNQPGDVPETPPQQNSISGDKAAGNTPGPEGGNIP